MLSTVIQPVINHGTDVVIAWSTAITTAATVAMAAFSFVMLKQLGHMKEQNKTAKDALEVTKREFEELEAQGKRADEWQRKNNLIIHFPYNVFKEYEKNLMDNLRISIPQYSNPLCDSDVAAICSDLKTMSAFTEYLNYLEGLCEVAEAEIVDEKLTRTLYGTIVMYTYGRFSPYIDKVRQGKDQHYCSKIEFYAKKWDSEPLSSE
jgi:hypothetical protein